MKREGNLYAKIAEPENLRLAFIKAAQGKRCRQEVIDFSADFSANIQLLHKSLTEHKPDIGHYRFFQVHDPKPRNICAASFHERVLHHAVMNYFEPVLERYLIYDTYACRIGKGHRQAIARAQAMAGKNNWYLQLDIHKYFDSIDHRVLLNHLSLRCKDPHLLELFEKLLMTYHVEPGKGLPIGNLISQHFANFYLAGFDHWQKEQRKIKQYLRYMDDFILFSHDAITLKYELQLIREWLADVLQLQLKNGIQLNRVKNGFTFLGFRLFSDKIKLSNRSKHRFRRKFKQYEHLYQMGKWSEAELIQHIEPLIDFTRIAAASGFRRNVIGF